jgi:uncharacterized protein YbjT (DUF2867 family)
MQHILIYSATGAQASPLLTKLQQGKHKLFALTRNKQAAAIQENEFVKVAEGRLSDVGSLKKVSSGMDVIMLNLPFFSDDRAGHNAIEAAKAANVQLIIWNANGPLPQQTSHRKKMNIRLRNMELLAASGIPYIVFQPTVYLENLLLPETARAIKERNVIEAVPPEDVAIPWMSAEDVCTCMVKSIHRKDLQNKVLTVAGSGWSGRELAHSFSEVLGRKITYQQISLEEYTQRLDNMMGAGCGAQIMGTAPDKDDRPIRAAHFAPFTSLDAFKELGVKPVGLHDWIAIYRSSFTEV